MKYALVTTLLLTTTTVANATVRFSSGTDSGFIAVILSVVATIGLTLLIRYALRKR